MHTLEECVRLFCGDRACDLGATRMELKILALLQELCTQTMPPSTCETLAGVGAALPVDTARMLDTNL